eukprot:jgi/Tetstr1/436485/TSEL_025313.t1
MAPLSGGKSTRRLDRMAGLLSEGEETISAVEAELRAKPVPTLVIRAETGKTKHLRLVWDTKFDTLMARIIKMFDIDTKSFKEHRVADRKIYTKTPEFRMKIKRPLYCPDEVFLAGCVERGGGLPEYDKDSVIITNIKEWRDEFESFPRGQTKQMAGMADFLFQKLQHSFYTWRLDGALGFWQLAQSVVEQGVQSGIFTEDMLDLILESIQRAYADNARYNPGVYSTGASCWMALWWLSSLNGIVMRGERSVVMPSVGNAHTILMRTAKWRARAKERVQAKKRQREKKSKKEAEAGDDMRSLSRTLTSAPRLQTRWAGMLGWMINHNIFSMFLRTHDYVLGQLDEFGERFMKRWRSDLVILNLGYSLGLLRSLLKQSSVAAHMRRVENPPRAAVDPNSEHDMDREEPPPPPPTDVLGVEAKRIWQSLFRVACMPIWAKVDGVTPNLEPMRLKDAVDRMERIAQLRRMQIERNEDARIQRFSLKAALELEGKYKTAPATKEPAATKPPQATKSDPNRKASMLRELRAKTAQMTTFKRRLYDADVNLLKMALTIAVVAVHRKLQGSSEDGKSLGVRAPGVVACEILLEQCLRGGDEALVALNQAIGMGALRDLLSAKVPMRVRHCAVAMLACVAQSAKGRRILQSCPAFHRFFQPLMALSTLEASEGAPGVTDWKNGDRMLNRYMDFGSTIAEHAACAVWGLANGLVNKARELQHAEDSLRHKKSITLTKSQIEHERGFISKSIRAMLQCSVEVAIGGHRAKVNSSAGFLASGLAILAKEPSIAEMLMDLRIVYDGLEDKKQEEINEGRTDMQIRLAKRRSQKEHKQAEDAAMLEDPDEVDQSVDPGTVNLLMDSPVLSVLEAAAAVVGLLAERSKPHTGGMEGIYRRRLLQNGAWLVLVRAVRVTNFQTAVLEETVAASLMYLAAEVPLMIAAGKPRRDGTPSQWKPAYLDKPLEELNLFVLTRRIDDLDSALDAHRVLLGAQRPNTVRCTATGIWLLARCTGLQGPLGEIGCVEALTGALRRWYELNPDERATNRSMGEWVMNAINLLCNNGMNLERFAHAFKPKPPKDFALLQLEQFKAEVMETQLKKLGNMGGPVTPSVTQAARWRPFGWKETPTPGAGTGSHSGPQSNTGYEDAIASKDPLQLLVQLLLLKGRSAETFKKIKVQVINMLKRAVQRQEYRQRLVDMGAGPIFWATTYTTEVSFDGTICSGAAYIWIYVAASPEGRAQAWWGGLDERIEAAAKAAPAGSAGLEGAIEGKAIMAVDLMKRVEVSQQRVGTRTAANLSGESERTKMAFLRAGGIDALLGVARAPLSDEATTLAAVTFNNVSSCVPYQKELCDKALFLILDISHRFRASRGIYNLQLPETGIAEEVSTAGPKERAMQVLRATAGALWNLSRNPENRSAFYKAELKHHTLSSLEDLKETDPEMYQACRDYGRIAEKKRRHHLAKTSDREKFGLASTLAAQQSQRADMLAGQQGHARTVDFLSKYGAVPRTNDASEEPPPRAQLGGNLAAAFGTGGTAKTGLGLTGTRMLGKILQKAKAKDLVQAPGTKLDGLSKRLRQPTASLWNELVVDRHNGPTVMLPIKDPNPPTDAVELQLAKSAPHSPSRVIRQTTLALPPPSDAQAASAPSTATKPRLAFAASATEDKLTDSAQVFEKSDSPRSTATSVCGVTPEDSATSNFGLAPHEKACTRWQPFITEYKIIRASDGTAVKIPAEELRRPATSSPRTPSRRAGALGAEALFLEAPPESDTSSLGQLTARLATNGPASPPALASFDALPARWAAATTEVREAAALEVVIGTGVARRRAINFKAESLQAAKAFSEGIALRSLSPSPERRRDGSVARDGDKAEAADASQLAQCRDGARPSSSHVRPVFGTTTARFDSNGNFSTAVKGDSRYTPMHPVKEFTSTRMDMWRTVEGSRVFEEMPKQTLPDGSQAIMYNSRKTRVDELYLGWAPNPPVATTLEELGHKGLPGCENKGPTNQPWADILHRVAELPYKPRPPNVPAPSPLPHVYDRLPNYSFGMEVTLEEWIEITREEDVIDPEDADDPAWAPAKGCALWGRKKESDFKSLTDSPKGMKKMFETDWAACMYRFTFVDFLAKDLVLARREMIVKEVTSVLRKHYPQLVAIYSYYSSLHPPELFKLTLQDFRVFLQHFKLVNPEVEGVREQDLEALFARVNPELAEHEGVASPTCSLFRNEFVELVVRLAQTKYMYGRRPITKVWGEALDMLFTEHLACPAFLSIEITLNRDEFRVNRLYRKPVDTYLRKHAFTFKALFSYFKSAGKESAPTYLDFSGWLSLLSRGGLTNDFFTEREALNCFIWSRTHKVDDTKKRPKATGMTYVDFLEGLGRVAELVSPPAVPDLRRQKYESDTPTYEYYQKVYHTDSGAPPLPDRLSSMFDHAKTRPLQHKMQQVMEVLLMTLTAGMECESPKAMLAHLTELAAAIPAAKK